MGVFGDDFAAVDFGEELCHNRLPKKQIEEMIDATILREYFYSDE